MVCRWHTEMLPTVGQFFTGFNPWHHYPGHWILHDEVLMAKTFAYGQLAQPLKVELSTMMYMATQNCRNSQLARLLCQPVYFTGAPISWLSCGRGSFNGWWVNRTYFPVKGVAATNDLNNLPLCPNGFGQKSAAVSTLINRGLPVQRPDSLGQFALEICHKSISYDESHGWR